MSEINEPTAHEEQQWSEVIRICFTVISKVSEELVFAAVANQQDMTAEELRTMIRDPRFIKYAHKLLKGAISEYKTNEEKIN